MSIPPQQTSKTNRNPYSSYLQKCTKLRFEDRAIIKKMVHQKQYDLLILFQKYQKHRNIDALQIELRKFVTSYKQNNKKRQITSDGCKNKNKSTKRIHSQGSQITTYRNSNKSSVEKHDHFKKVITFDVSELIRRLKAEKNKQQAQTAPTKRTQNPSKYIKNLSNNSSVSKFKLMPSIQQQISLQNICQSTTAINNDPKTQLSTKRQQNKQQLNMLFQISSNAKEQNKNKINYLSNKRISSHKRLTIQIPQYQPQSYQQNKQNNINAQNWIIVDHQKVIYNHQNQNQQKEVQFKIIHDYDHQSTSKNMHKKSSERIFPKSKYHLQEQFDMETDRLISAGRLTQGKGKIKSNKNYCKLLTLESESRQEYGRQVIKEGPFYRKIKEIIYDNNY